jgi:hypothetical protein
MLGAGMPALRRARPRLPLALVILGSSAVACGSPPPVAPAAPAPAPAASASKEPLLDTSPVPEPPGLVLVARMTKPDAVVSAVGSWTRLPLPSGADLVRSIAEDTVAEVVDLSQPVDAAVTLTLSRRGVDPLFAFSVAVKSYEQAKAKLGTKHRLVPGDNGQLKVEGLGMTRRPSRPPPVDGEGGPDDADESEGDDGEGCVLAPAAQGGRLVCGERAALTALVPYLSRTMPREKWASDVHVEVRPEPVRAPLQELRTSIPILARSLLGAQSSAVRDLVDASLGEVIDIVDDVQKLTIDAQIAESGVVATTRIELQSNKSLFARAITIDRPDSPPAAFWHLPGDTDTAFFSHASDPKLFDHPRELATRFMLEATESAGMPEAERHSLKDLISDRLSGLFSNGPGVYGKGFDAAALEKAVTNLKGIRIEDRAARAEGERVLLEQIVGWHLVQVNEPVAKVGPFLKDCSALWNRPAFAKWVQSKASAKLSPRMRIVPAPVGVTLPKETVHLEVTIPRADIDASLVVPVVPASGNGGPRPVAKPSKAKMVPQKPIVFHVLAVPDGAATWLGFGLDAKLVAQKAAASLASAPDANTLGKAAGMEALREGKLNSGGVATMRGLMVFTLLEGERAPFGFLGVLPHRGSAPLLLTGRTEAPSATAKAGVSVGTARVSRAFIEDIVKLVMSAN